MVEFIILASVVLLSLGMAYLQYLYLTIISFSRDLVIIRFSTRLYLWSPSKRISWDQLQEMNNELVSIIATEVENYRKNNS